MNGVLMVETVLDKYFELSDTAGTDPEDLERLVALFTDDAVVTPNGGAPVRGRAAVRQFFTTFFARNVASRHMWTTRIEGSRITVTWGVVFRRVGGQVFTFSGTDIAEVSATNLIQSLTVRSVTPAPISADAPEPRS